MQAKNGDVWQAREPLQELLKEPWPVKTAYGLARLGRRINEQAMLIEQVRTRLITQYGVANGAGQIAVTPDSPNWANFVTCFNELMDEDADIPLDKVILPDVEGLSLQPSILMALVPFVEMS